MRIVDFIDGFESATAPTVEGLPSDQIEVIIDGIVA